jgi:hypothetical protein
MTMKNTRFFHEKYVLIPFLIFLFLCITFFSFFAFAFARLNLVIGFANSGRDVAAMDESFISENDFLDLSFVSPVDTNTQYYVNGGCKYTVSSFKSGILSISGTANYTVFNFQNDDVIETIQNQKFLVEMQFEHGKWIIIHAERIL